MGTNLDMASHQWQNRPADERYWTVTDLHAACLASRKASAERIVPVKAIGVDVIGAHDLVLTNKATATATAKPVTMTHYAFGQVANLAGAPADYLRSLPAGIVKDALNHGLSKADASDRNMLFRANGSITLRAMTSEKYSRVWNAEVTARLLALASDGWRNPAGRAPGNYQGPTKIATAADILPGQINIGEGMTIVPSGLYAGDRDMFAFLVAPDRCSSDGGQGALMRGVIVRNSEVGDASLSVLMFLMDTVCGNHIIWNATNVHEIKVRHVGADPMGRWANELASELIRYRDGSDEDTARMVVAARNTVIGKDREEVLDAVFKYAKSHSLSMLTRSRIDAAIDTAERDTRLYGNPRSVWGVISGLTSNSQQASNAGDRTAIDTDAGKLLAMAGF